MSTRRYRIPGYDRVVPESETHLCPPCQGDGRDYDPWPAVKVCRTCHGSGRLLGSIPNQTWPVAVELVEEDERVRAAS